MVKWRVGTLSMGISLIALGVILLIALLGGYGIIDQLFKWWPLLLIIMGGEVLLYIALSKGEQAKVKYDIFSMFMIMVIFIASGIFYAIISTGIVRHATANINGRDYTVMIPQEEIKIDENIKRIIIKAPSRATLEVNKAEGKQLIYRGNSEVFTDSLETAKEMVEGRGIHVSQVEDTLYLQFPTFDRRQDLKTGVTMLNYDIFIPQGVDVEIKGNNHYYSRVVVNGDAVKGNWLISQSNSVQINGNSESNFEVEAMAEHRHGLKGNVEWETKEQEDGYTVGKTSFGNGIHKLTILKSSVEAINTP